MVVVKKRLPVKLLRSSERTATATTTENNNTATDKSVEISKESRDDIFDCVEIEHVEVSSFEASAKKSPSLKLKFGNPVKQSKNSLITNEKKGDALKTKIIVEKRVTRSTSASSSSLCSSGINSLNCSFENSPIKKKLKSKPKLKLKLKSKTTTAKPKTKIYAKATKPTTQSLNRRNKKNTERLERIREILKVNGIVEPLPGRLEEFDWIKTTILRSLESSLGGCLYISGVPGTGKTATTHRTLDYLTLSALKGECRDFDFVEINGMRISDPGQAYSILANTILPPPKGKKNQKPMSGATALKKLEVHFKAQQKEATGRPCVVLLDELDLLLKKKQSILYHFFEWPNWVNSRLIVITIANTMDLPERFLSNRISSRLGLTRYNFKPYEHGALANIIEHQLKDYVQFLGREAIQLCARKVAAVSGDARRAINLSRRAVDYFRSCSQDELIHRTTGKLPSSNDNTQNQQQQITAVNLRLMDIVLKDALMANPVQVIGQLAKHQRLMLLSILLARKKVEDEAALRGGTRITGLTNSVTCPTIERVLEQHFQLCRTHQFLPLPSLQELYGLLSSLEALRLLRVLRFREGGPEGLIQLLVHEEDVRKGLGDDQALRKYTIS